MDKEQAINFVDELAIAVRNDNKALAITMAELGKAYAERARVSGLIDKKWSTLVNDGSIGGKNADERKASAWIQIPENDELVICEMNVSKARTKFDLAELEYKTNRAILDAYKSILVALASD